MRNHFTSLHLDSCIRRWERKRTPGGSAKAHIHPLFDCVLRPNLERRGHTLNLLTPMSELHNFYVFHVNYFYSVNFARIICELFPWWIATFFAKKKVNSPRQVSWTSPANKFELRSLLVFYYLSCNTLCVLTKTNITNLPQIECELHP